MIPSRPYVFALLLLACLPAIGQAQTVKGRVVEYGTDRPLAGADVYLMGENDAKAALTFSDSTGLFRIAAPAAGAWVVGAQLIGYGTVRSDTLDIGKDATVEVEIRMAIDPVDIEEPVVVVAQRGGSPELAAFWRRVERGERTGFGRFIYGEDLERATVFATDALRMVPGVRVVPGRVGDGQTIRMTAGCIPAVFLDGMELNRVRRGESLDIYVNPSDIEGIEVYRGPQQPGGFYYDRSGCGTVLVCTKRGEPGGRPFTWTRLFLGLALVVGVLLTR